jgi:hypothetical protein
VAVPVSAVGIGTGSGMAAGVLAPPISPCYGGCDRPAGIERGRCEGTTMDRCILMILVVIVTVVITVNRAADDDARPPSVTLLHPIHLRSLGNG